MTKVKVITHILIDGYKYSKNSIAKWLKKVSLDNFSKFECFNDIFVFYYNKTDNSIIEFCSMIGDIEISYQEHEQKKIFGYDKILIKDEMFYI